MNLEVADEIKGWLNDEVMAALKELRGHEAAKKRYTILAIAFATARQQPITRLFKDDPKTCATSIWYDKWQHDPKIRTALELAVNRALEWQDQQTAMIEAHYEMQRRRSLAEHSADAPVQLADVMEDHAQSGMTRIKAAETLLSWADPETAGKTQPSLTQAIKTYVSISPDDWDDDAPDAPDAAGDD